MCKELGQMSVASDDKKPEPNADGQPSEPPTTQQQSGEVNFRKLIIERCQKQFQKNNDDEHARISKLKEIEDCADPVSWNSVIRLASFHHDALNFLSNFLSYFFFIFHFKLQEKKKDLQTSLEEYDRRLRVRSVGNIR